MMRQYDLIERVRRYNPHTDEALLNRAYVYAMKAHGEQKRASGDPYFSHPLEVAAILTDLKLDDATIAAALLHDTIEDTPTTRAEIDQTFGPDIGHLVEGLTKLKKLDLVSREAKQAENLRKLLLAIADDVRVLLVKLADRLHNMRTLEHMPAGRAQAHCRGDARHLCAACRPHGHAWIARGAGGSGVPPALSRGQSPGQRATQRPGRAPQPSDRGDRAAAHAQARRTPARDATVTGRRKRPYSIWRKMERKSVGFEQLSDIFGFRVIVKTIREVYRALGIVHTTWPMVPGRFKDYVSTPKQNDYRSIHTTVIGPGKQRVELQIRTEEMHEIAEYGIAAHALYKDSADSPTEMLSRESNAYAWLRRTIELLAEGSNPEEFLEHTKLELFHDQVFCFTPKGKLIALPRKATPIDFAYAVHTDVGNRAVGCKINGQISPLVSELNNGDEVDIITSKAQTAPPAAWESIVVTGKARLAIRRATRNATARAIRRARPPHRRAAVPARQARIFRREAHGRAAAAGAGFDRRRVRRRRPRRDAAFRRRARDVSGLQGGAHRRVPPPKSESGWFGLKKGKAVMFKVPAAEQAIVDPDPRHQLRSAGALCAERRRGAGRPYRRHPHSGRGHHHLSDPVADLEGFRGDAGALARRALGHGRAHPAAFPGADRGAVA